MAISLKLNMSPVFKDTLYDFQLSSSMFIMFNFDTIELANRKKEFVKILISVNKWNYL